MKSKILISILTFLIGISIAFTIQNFRIMRDLKKQTPIDTYYRGTIATFKDDRPDPPPLIRTKNFIYLLTEDSRLSVFKYTTSTGWTNFSRYDFSSSTADMPFVDKGMMIKDIRSGQIIFQETKFNFESMITSTTSSDGYYLGTLKVESPKPSLPSSTTKYETMFGSLKGNQIDLINDKYIYSLIYDTLIDNTHIPVNVRPELRQYYINFETIGALKIVDFKTGKLISKIDIGELSNEDITIKFEGKYLVVYNKKEIVKMIDVSNLSLPHLVEWNKP